MIATTPQDSDTTFAPYVPSGHALRGLQAALAALQVPGKAVETPVPTPEPVRYPATAEDYTPSAEEGLSDHRVAEAMVKSFGADLRYAPERRRWLVWDGRRWAEQSDSAAVEQRVISTARDIQSWAVGNVANHGQRAEVLKQALRLESNTRVKDVVERAQALPEIRTPFAAFDASPFLLNVENGTLDLKTGMLHAHCREDLLTQLTPITYDAAASAPRWSAFLRTIFREDEELMSYIQRVVGYSLTGVVAERAFFVLYGSGRNGKSVFLETLKALFGDYAAALNPEALMMHREGQHPADLAMLRGVRMAYAQETGEGRRLNEPLVKSLTGGDTITVRLMRENPWQMQPTFKTWMITNSKPLIYETGTAMWDRVKLVPFLYTVPESKKIPLHIMVSRFIEDEGAGILRWAVEGCAAYLAEGLTEPTAVREEIASYREEMDVLGRFLAECCETGREDYTATPDALYSAYTQWCEGSGETGDRGGVFSRKLTERGYPLKTERAGSVTRKVRTRIRLKTRSI